MNALIASTKTRHGGRLPFALTCMALWTLAAQAAPLPASMTLVTVNGRPASGQRAVAQRGITVKVYNLDALNNLLQDIKAAVPPALRRLPNPTPTQRAQIEAALKQAAQRLVAKKPDTYMLPALAAQRWGIDKAPAVIFDEGVSVIYGVTDLSEALRLWQQQNTGPG